LSRTFVVLAFVTLTLVIVTVIGIVGIARAALSGDASNVDLPYTALTAGLGVLGVAGWVFYLSRPVEKD
jgi:hypothetical protein